MLNGTNQQFIVSDWCSSCVLKKAFCVDIFEELRCLLFSTKNARCLAHFVVQLLLTIYTSLRVKSPSLLKSTVCCINSGYV